MRRSEGTAPTGAPDLHITDRGRLASQPCATLAADARIALSGNRPLGRSGDGCARGAGAVRRHDTRGVAAQLLRVLSGAPAAVTPQHSLLPVVPEVNGLQDAARYRDGLRDDVALLAVRPEDRDARPAARPTWTAEATGS
ncbi:MAG: hypothetical protein JWR81_437 [Pseudonocardia sp.]|jgi:hypothetical protein|nr:hypothetical protein [Pseudonocardia sp.]MDT7615903.1 hypothetical protein [Pseudonocardiales bacterium]